MKKIILFFSSILAVLTFVGCQPSFVLDVAGLPKELTINHNVLPETIIAGNDNFLFTYIRDDNGNKKEAVYHKQDFVGEFTNVTLDWLTVKSFKNDNNITIMGTNDSVGDRKYNKDYDNESLGEMGYQAQEFDDESGELVEASDDFFGDDLGDEVYEDNDDF